MRKVTETIVNAWMNGKKKTVANTTTDGQSIYLHGHKIIEKREDDSFIFSMCGWGTPTTRERINAVFNTTCPTYGISQRNHEQWYVGNEGSGFDKLTCLDVNKRYLVSRKGKLSEVKQ